MQIDLERKSAACAPRQANEQPNEALTYFVGWGRPTRSVVGKDPFLHLTSKQTVSLRFHLNKGRNISPYHSSSHQVYPHLIGHRNRFLLNLRVPDLKNNLRYFPVMLTPFTAVEKGVSFSIKVWKSSFRLWAVCGKYRVYTLRTEVGRLSSFLKPYMAE